MLFTKTFILLLCLNISLFAAQREYMLPTFPILLNILEEYNAPLSYSYVLNMANQQMAAHTLFSNIDKSIPEDSQKRTFSACLTLAILQRSTPSAPQTTIQTTLAQKPRKQKWHPKIFF